MFWDLCQPGKLCYIQLGSKTGQCTHDTDLMHNGFFYTEPDENK